MNAPAAGAGLRVLHLGKFYPPASGGMEAHVQTLARAQAALGAQVEVLCANHSAEGAGTSHEFQGRSPTRESWDGPVRVLRLGRLASVARMDVMPDLPRALGGALARGVDVVHLHTPNPTWVLALDAVRRLPPVFVTHHSDVIRQKVAGALFKPFEALLYARARRVLATSAAYVPGSPLLRAFRGKVRALPLGLDLAPYLQPSAAAREAQARWREQAAGAPLWLMVGRLVYYKGLFTALEALARVPGRLVVVGQGPLEAEARRRARALGVADRVTWTGYLPPDALVGALHAATALWFCGNARSEAYGLSQVEAMASGLPVLNTAIPHSGVAWVSLHEQTGLTVPVGDAAALAAAARRLVEEPGLARRLGRGARERAVAEFRHDVMAWRSLSLYAEALGRPIPSGAPEDLPRRLAGSA
ncbi:glycosyltransferase [Corallococcus macrosporus]|uniref:Glycosyl transferase family 1 n=1 Tax=Corallococcus macrosporus DSM 14697 TaxID=1189310 RepID=A0A250JNK3_9BACT|nr:glycosyltransferase [Corallococcus macrosporus]ATB45464.1 glycosyl transferase family 1 [Corallococcus macrosporus DSM 14697]